MNKSKEELVAILLAQQASPLKPVISGKLSSPKSLTLLAAEKLEQSIRRPAVKSVRDKIKCFEEKAIKNTKPSIIRPDSQSVSLQDMRDEELARARVSKFDKQSSFQNMFEQRLQQMPGKREKVQITIQAEHTLGNRTEIIEKSCGPFKKEVPKLSKPDVYKFFMYTLLKNNFTVLSTETIKDIGATITTHNEQFFKDHAVGALKLNTFFLDKQFNIKRRSDNLTCMVNFNFVWHNCRDKKGFKTYTYQN